MTQEEKLLLQDLCARLPFGVKAQYYGSAEEMLTVDTIEAIYTQPSVEIVIGQYGLEIKDIKPYLRPLSCMTKEEDKEWQFYKCKIAESCDEKLPERIADLHEWMYKKMFDYHGLVPKGLAISTEDFNPYKD